MLNGTSTSSSSMGGPLPKGVDKRRGMSMNSSSSSGIAGKGKKTEEMVTEDIDPEFTVRGRLHWVGVMKDWEWEGEFPVIFSSFIHI
jgi:hypothetical protein